MTGVVVLVGNPRAGSRTRELAETVAGTLHSGFQVLELAEIVRVSFGPQPAYATVADVDPFATVRSARLLIVATPAYKGSFTGLLKVFLDQFGHRELVGVTAVAVAVGASAAHAEATASALRDVLAELGARILTPLAVPESRLDDAHQIASHWADTAFKQGAIAS